MIRERREELASQIGYIANTPVPLLNGVPRDLPLTRLWLVLEGRMTQAAQTVAGNILPEAPASLVRNIQLKGNKVTGGGSITLVNIRGEEAHQLTRFYETVVPIGPGLADAAGAGGVAFPAPLAATANGSFDFRVVYEVPIAPRFCTQGDEIAGILDPSIFSTLELSVQFGDASYLVTANTAPTPTLSAFGSAAGSPTIYVTRYSPLAEGLPIMRYHYTYNSRQLTQAQLGAAAAVNTKIADLNGGNKVRAIMLRQYSELANKPGLIDQLAAASLARIGDNSNPGIYRWSIRLNGSEKFRMRNPDLRETNRQQFGAYSSLMPQGYAVIDFADRGFLEDIFDARGFGATATRFELFGDWTGLAATDRLDILQIEQVPVEY